MRAANFADEAARRLLRTRLAAGMLADPVHVPIAAGAEHRPMESHALVQRLGGNWRNRQRLLVVPDHGQGVKVPLGTMTGAGWPCGGGAPAVVRLTV